jgi:acyl-ACP thioesterase
MSGRYTETFTATASECDPFQRLRFSSLLEKIQACTIADTSEHGVPREKTLDRGLLWVTARQKYVISRLPVYDEKYTVETWPGKTMHVLFPRYVCVRAGGEVIVTGSVLWLLMDRESRQMIFPDQYDIHLEGEDEQEIPLPKMVPAVRKGLYHKQRAGYSLCDLNGHLNNARYFDLAMDVIPEPAEGKELQSADIDYVHEIVQGNEVSLIHEKNERDQKEYISGYVDSQIAFRMALSFKEK